MTLYFKNKGLLDINAVVTMGVSVKSETAIGHFGTGLKYALAIIFSLGGKVTIHSGLDSYYFSTKKQKIHGKDFEVVCYRKNESKKVTPTGFTTQLGKHWLPWMALREIICNTLDEKGFATTKEVVLDKDCTVIVVDCKELETIADAVDNSVVLGGVYQNNKTKNIETVANIEVCEGCTSSFYNLGVNVFQLDNQSLYTYNCKEKLTLTEDRTLAYTHQPEYSVVNAILKSNNQDFIVNCLTAEDGYFEAGLDYTSNGRGVSVGFKKAIESLIVKKENFNESARTYYERQFGGIFSLSENPHAEHYKKETLRVMEALIREFDLNCGLHNIEVKISSQPELCHDGSFGYLKLVAQAVGEKETVWVSERLFLEDHTFIAQQILIFMVQAFTLHQNYTRDQTLLELAKLLLETKGASYGKPIY